MRRPPPFLRSTILAAALVSSSLLFAQPKSFFSNPDVLRAEMDSVLIIDTEMASPVGGMDMDAEMALLLLLKKYPYIVYVHPSPSAGVIRIEHRLRGEVLARVLSDEGKEVIIARGVNSKKIDLSILPKGDYSLVLTHEGGEVIKPIAVIN